MVYIGETKVCSSLETYFSAVKFDRKKKKEISQIVRDVALSKLEDHLKKLRTTNHYLAFEEGQKFIHKNFCYLDDDSSNFKQFYALTKGFFSKIKKEIFDNIPKSYYSENEPDVLKKQSSIDAAYRFLLITSFSNTFNDFYGDNMSFSKFEKKLNKITTVELPEEISKHFKGRNDKTDGKRVYDDLSNYFRGMVSMTYFTNHYFPLHPRKNKAVREAQLCRDEIIARKSIDGLDDMYFNEFLRELYAGSLWNELTDEQKEAFKQMISFIYLHLK